jgi:hypothetical protein
MWGLATFGRAKPRTLLKRMCEEIIELNDKLASKPAYFADHNSEAKWIKEVALELADIYIMLVQLAASLSVGPLIRFVNEKMKINRKRKWNVFPSGVGYHVKERENLNEQ